MSVPAVTCDRTFWQAGERANLLKSGATGEEFVLRDSNVTFENGAIMTLSHPFLKLIGNDFKGNGRIMVGTGEELSGVETSELAGNRLDGVRLLFGDINENDGNFLLRNNELANRGSLSFRSGSPQGCDIGNSGRSVGCDPRAECKPAAVGVQCSCLKPLQPVKAKMQCSMGAGVPSSAQCWISSRSQGPLMSL